MYQFVTREDQPTTLLELMKALDVEGDYLQTVIKHLLQQYQEYGQLLNDMQIAFQRRQQLI